MAGSELGGMPVSAPGAFSTRTDMDPQPVMDIPASYYGEGQELREIQAGAPMYGTPAPPRPPALFADTGRPDEPVTSGVDFGPGMGSDALTMSAPDYVPAQSLSSTLSKLSQVRPNDERLARLRSIAQKNGW